MCLQCTTDSVSYGSFLPGWALMRAQKDANDEWKAGEWGLVRCNDPDVIWAGNIVGDPAFGLSDYEIDTLARDEAAAFDTFYEEADKLRRALYLEPELGWSLCEEAAKHGWDKKESMHFWLMRRLFQIVSTRRPLTNDEQLTQDYEPPTAS